MRWVVAVDDYILSKMATAIHWLYEHFGIKQKRLEHFLNMLYVVAFIVSCLQDGTYTTIFLCLYVAFLNYRSIKCANKSYRLYTRWSKTYFRVTLGCVYTGILLISKFFPHPVTTTFWLTLNGSNIFCLSVFYSLAVVTEEGERKTSQSAANVSWLESLTWLPQNG